ncbi:DgyrCDS14181 [Dimorphilus gyrociliatus]|uniref:DgyrCDS14181 n=1 Tax=Dimorphilus gyrociliatus TaxID=2664684 RepID=A0A7I8WD48_9ANNE|nr:DgyrCDS14181 [Dimorphilus gyrociliatus]
MDGLDADGFRIANNDSPPKEDKVPEENVKKPQLPSTIDGSGDSTTLHGEGTASGVNSTEPVEQDVKKEKLSKSDIKSFGEDDIPLQQQGNTELEITEIKEKLNLNKESICKITNKSDSEKNIEKRGDEGENSKNESTQALCNKTSPQQKNIDSKNDETKEKSIINSKTGCKRIEKPASDCSPPHQGSEASQSSEDFSKHDTRTGGQKLPKKSDEFQQSKKKPLEDTLHLGKTEISIPCHLSHEKYRKIEYRYGFVKPGNQKPKTYETLQDFDRACGSKRTLCLADFKDLYHNKKLYVLDGFIHSKKSLKKSIFGRVYKFISGFVKHETHPNTMAGINAFMPCYKNFDGTHNKIKFNSDGEFLKIMMSFFRTFLGKDKIFMKSVITEYINKCIEALRPSQDMKAKMSLSLISCLFIAEFELEVKLAPFSLFDLEKSNSKCVNDIFQTIFEEFSDCLPIIPRLIKQLVNNCIKAGINDEWFFIVPLYHLFSDSYKILSPKHFVAEHQSEKWWNTDWLSEVKKLKTHIMETDPQESKKSLQLFKNIFEIDEQLPVLFAATRPFSHLSETFSSKMFRPEIIMASFYFWFKEISGSLNLELDPYLSPSILGGLSDGLEKMKENNHSREEWIVLCDISFSLLKKLQDSYETFESRFTAFVINLIIMTLSYASDKIELPKTKSYFEKFKTLFDIKLRIYNSNSFRILLFFSDILRGSTIDHYMASSVYSLKKDFFQNQTLKVLQKMYSDEIIQFYYANDLQTCHEHIEVILNEKAISALVESMKGTRVNSFDHKNERYINLLAETLARATKDKRDRRVFLFEWLCFPNFFQQYFKVINRATDASLKYIRIMNPLISETLQVIEHIYNGSIELSLYKKVNQTEYIKLIHKLGEINEFREHKNILKHLPEIIKARNEEVKVFLETFMQLKKFESFLSKFNKRALWDSSTTGLKINEFCFPRSNETLNNPVMLTSLNYDEEIMKAIQNCESYKDSLKFENILLQSFARERCDTISFQDAINSHIENGYNEYLKWSEDFVNGKLSLKEVDRILMLALYKPNCIKKEMELSLRAINMKFNESDISERVEKITLYQSALRSQKIAGALLKIKEEYNLTGDFSTMLTLSTLVNNKDTKLDELTDEVLKQGGRLADVTDDQIKVLDSFRSSKTFIFWLKKHIQSATEVNTLLDLIMTSEYEMQDVCKISCLQSVTRAYSSLIYDFDDSDGSSELLEKLEKTWSYLKDDRDLPKKLMDLTKQLDWLEAIKKSYGSAEIQAYDTVKDINDFGIFTVKTEISVKIVKEDSTKELNYDKLKELLSKLTLRTGIRDDEKNKTSSHFIKMYDGLTRLLEDLNNLRKIGSLLFSKCSFEFRENPNSEFNVEIDIGLSDRILLGKKETNLEEHLSNVCVALEKYIDEWSEYVRKNRDKYSGLNYFSSQQILILRETISHFLNNNEISDELIYLCSIVNPICTKTDVEQAILSASEEIKNESSKIDSQDACDGGSLSSTETDEKNTYERLIEHGFPNQLVREACEDNRDYDEAYIYCLENEDSYKEGEQEKENSCLTDAKTLKDKFSELNINSEGKSQLEESICEKLNALWNNFLNFIEYNKDYISFDHLGLILERLYKKPLICYEFPSNLIVGRPNLIVCDEKKTWSTVLHLFLKGPESPLPLISQILICNERTTAEDVELIYRRAASSTDQLFAIVNSHNLGFEASDRAEKIFDDLQSQEKTSKMKLVVLCPAEKQGQCRLVTSLDHYRVEWKSLKILPDDILKEKVLEQFSTTDCESAAILDSKKSTVRFITSNQAGNGKSLWINCLRDRLQKSLGNSKMFTYRFHGMEANINDLVNFFHTSSNNSCEEKQPLIFHLDVSNLSQTKLDDILFSLTIQRGLIDENGRVWKRQPEHYYLIECLKCGIEKFNCLEFLPKIQCQSPIESLRKYQENNIDEDEQLMNEDCDDFLAWRKTYQYLYNIHNKRNFNTNVEDLSPKSCVETLLQFSGTLNPSWAELRNYAVFLNKQLSHAEKNDFCATDDLPDFFQLIVNCMIKMARDFSTRSLLISEETPNVTPNKDYQIELMAIKHRWETRPHPYLFFNSDNHTFTFFGFNVEKKTGNLVDVTTGEVILNRAINRQLHCALIMNGVDLSETFDTLSKENKLKKMFPVFIESSEYKNYDANQLDDTYELTMDNCLKILAIHMKLKCKIPVIIMGETGCGKTRLIDYYSRLLKPPDKKNVKNRILMKIHGGITIKDIENKVIEAQALAQKNSNIHNLDTLLFFDEANTTEAIYAIKEILCDDSLNGKALNCNQYRLRIIAACNPYRKHKANIIEMLEKAGLGYYAKESKDKLGGIPMRQLVYRVQALPHSMLPFVWDFGNLSSEAEKIYIKHIVKRTVNCSEELSEVITDVLSCAQNFMRKDETECRFVSLRDVERTMTVMKWFATISETLLPLINNKKAQLLAKREGRVIEEKNFEDSNFLESNINDNCSDSSDSYCSEVNDNSLTTFNNEIRALILSIGVCYYCSLNQSRNSFLKEIGNMLERYLPEDQDLHEILYDEILACQEVFLDGLDLGTSSNPIARNTALRENVWMITICIELRIPLFIIGKPGSSKSLSKAKVEESMQGKNSTSEFFRHLKHIQMMSYQCSRLSTPEGIVETFKKCTELQEEKNMSEFAAVIVLDEIGLAEDSPLMPLKALHALLDDGSIEDEICLSKPSFIGISNWALDPAKMNRGVVMNCCVPDQNELKKTLKEICGNNRVVLNNISSFLDALTEGYAEVNREAERLFREFFGLRDFYHLIKMVYYFCNYSSKRPTYNELEHAVKRNLGGLMGFDSFYYFANKIDKENCSISEGNEDENSAEEILKRSLKGEELGAESRYILLITENYAALNLLKDRLGFDYNIIFGSSFRKDQEYSQLCLNIHRVKICMELGKSVILLNLDSIYESLYDALNQYYSYFGGQRFVDIGLGNNRIKAQVHKNFRLIVVAEVEDVKRFPTPLLNRLEKHCLTVYTLLHNEQKIIVESLEEWTSLFLKATNSISSHEKLEKKDIFIGFGNDTIPTLVLKYDNKSNKECLIKIKEELLRVATLESIIKNQTILKEEQLSTIEEIYVEQDHFLSVLKTYENEKFIQITTHSRLLTGEEFSSIRLENAEMHMLHNFDTEYEFDNVLQKMSKSSKILILQSDTTDVQLLACARFKVEEDKIQLPKIIFIVRVTRTGSKFNGIHGGKWTCVHVDELRRPRIYCSIQALKGKSIPLLFEASLVKTNSDLDCDSIVNACLIEAVSLLRDKKAIDLNRSSDRLKILRKAFQDENVFYVFKKKIIELLKDREEAVGGGEASRWLEKYTTSLKAVTEAGTFQKSWQMFVKTRVTIILACIIAMADKNFNLNGLEDNHELWLRIFDDERIGHLSFMTLTDGIPTPVEVGLDHLIKTNLPTKLSFSWILFEKVESFVDQVLEHQSDKEAIKNQLYREEIFSLFNDYAEDWRKSYLYDALLMLHNPLSNDHKSELEIIYKIQCDLMDEEIDVLDYHLLYNDRKKIFEVAFTLAKVQDDLLIQLLKKPSEFFFDETKEMIIDLKIVEKVLANFDHLRKSLSEQESRKKWKECIQMIRSPMEKILASRKGHKIADKCLSNWMKVRIMELYLNHVVMEGDKEFALEEKKLQGLWIYLNKVKSWKDVDLLVQLKRFLQTMRESLYKTVFKEKVPRCNVEACREIISGQDLVCGHNLCEKCESDCKTSAKPVCRLCKEPFSFSNSTNIDFETAREILNTFHNRCNNFFIFIINSYCFTGSDVPDEKLIDFILSCVTCKSLNQTCYTTNDYVFDNVIDPNPVLRSFALKQLLKYAEGTVLKKLDEFFKQLNNEIKVDVTEDVSRIVINNMEDSFYNDYIQTDKMNRKRLLIENIRKYKEIMQTEQVDQDNQTQLMVSIAVIRLCLKKIVDIFIDNTKEIEDERVIQVVRELCHGPNDFPRKFFLKCIYNQYGIKELIRISKLEDFNWLIPFETFPNKTTPDVFSLYNNETYREIRNCFDSKTISEEIFMDPNGKPYLFILALYSAMSATEFHNLRDYLQKLKDLKCSMENEELWNRLIEEDFLRNLQFPNKNDLFHDPIATLIFHADVVIRYSKKAILEPLKKIVSEPRLMNQWFLPTMPDNILGKMKNDLMGLNYSENISISLCPNGHPYLIGNCGKPASQGECNVCKAQIGGLSHTYVSGNRLATKEDFKTLPGHILGEAKFASNEFRISKTHTKILRAVLHIMMLVAANEDPDAVSECLRKIPNSIDHFQFLMNHLKNDIKNIKKSLKISKEAVCILLHSIFKLFMTSKCSTEVCLWENPENREKWEKIFATNFITEAINDIDKAQRIITEDDRLSSNPLLSSLVQTDEKVKDIILQRCSEVWINRDIIDLESTLQELRKQEKTNEIDFILLALTKVNELEAIKYLPDIIQLIYSIVTNLRGKFLRSDLKTITITSYLSYTDEDQALDMFKSFTNAWKICRNSLCKIEINGKHLPEEILSMAIDEKTPLEYLLPSTKGNGLASFALINYLVNLQNNLVTKNSELSNSKLEYMQIDETLSIVDVINIDPERNVETLILSTYSYEIDLQSKQSSVKYDFYSLRRQISSSWLENLPVLQFERPPEIVCRDDLRMKSKLKEVGIDQIPLSKAVGDQISAECIHIEEVCESLSILNIAVGYLATISNVNPKTKLIAFLEDLRIRNESLLKSAEKNCNIEHVEDFWHILSRERDKLLIDHQLFITPDSSLIDEEQQKAIRNCIGSNLKVAEDIVIYLHRTIHEHYDHDRMLLPLRDVYIEYLQEKELPVAEQILTWPKDILLKNGIEVWKIVYEIVRSESRND